MEKSKYHVKVAEKDPTCAIFFEKQALSGYQGVATKSESRHISIEQNQQN